MTRPPRTTVAELHPNIGRRIVTPEGVGGTIIGAFNDRGWARYRVRWDEDAPDWWTDVINPGSSWCWFDDEEW